MNRAWTTVPTPPLADLPRPVGVLTPGEGAPGTAVGSWPGFRGPKRRRHLPGSGLPRPDVAGGGTAPAVVGRRRRGVRRRRDPRRARLPAGLRPGGGRGRAALPVLRRRARDLALRLPGQGQAQPRHEPDRARRDGPLRRRARSQVPRHLPRRRDRRREVDDRPRPRPRRDGPAVVRRAVPAHRRRRA